jgi:hypothetical protein
VIAASGDDPTSESSSARVAGDEMKIVNASVAVATTVLRFRFVIYPP